MAEAIILMANGVEEIEAVATVDLLRRAGITTKMLSIEDVDHVKGAHGIGIITDARLADYKTAGDERILILPGGGEGHTRLKNHPMTEGLLRDYRADGRYIAAICAAPTVLGEHDLLAGMKSTVYPGMQDGLGQGAEHVDEPVVHDEWYISGRAPDAAIPFALKIIEILRGGDIAEEVSQGIVRS